MSSCLYICVLILCVCVWKARFSALHSVYVLYMCPRVLILSLSVKYYVHIYMYIYYLYIYIYITSVIYIYVGSEACVLWGVLSRDYGGLGQ